MIKLKKLFENLPLISIVIALILLYSNSKQMKFHIAVIIIILFLFAFFMDLYLDIKNRQYSTAIFIIMTDVVGIVAFIALLYFYNKNIDKANNELLWERAENIRRLGLFIILMPSIKSILKSQRFEKKHNS